MHPQALVREHLDSGALVELKPGRPLDVTLYWQHARMASSLLRELTQAVSLAAKDGLVQRV
jgi:LysR family transcriptional regulator (chromosome initiation inhibitor)